MSRQKAAPVAGHQLTSEQGRALVALACTEGVFRSHGFTVGLIAGLIRGGLIRAAAEFWGRAAGNHRGWAGCAAQSEFRQVEQLFCDRLLLGSKDTAVLRRPRCHAGTLGTLSACERFTVSLAPARSPERSPLIEAHRMPTTTSFNVIEMSQSDPEPTSAVHRSTSESAVAKGTTLEANGSGNRYARSAIRLPCRREPAAPSGR
jgi:hypothetical protein